MKFLHHLGFLGVLRWSRLLTGLGFRGLGSRGLGFRGRGERLGKKVYTILGFYGDYIPLFPTTL